MRGPGCWRWDWAACCITAATERRCLTFVTIFVIDDSRDESPTKSSDVMRPRTFQRTDRVASAAGVGVGVAEAHQHRMSLISGHLLKLRQFERKLGLKLEKF